jgi:hypothetical protein
MASMLPHCETRATAMSTKANTLIANRTAGTMNTPRQSSFAKLTEGLRLYIRREMAMKGNEINKVVDFLL